MRVRTGHQPDQWVDEGPAAPVPIGSWFRATASAAEPRPTNPNPDGRARLPRPTEPCAIEDRCRHRPCVERRVAEAKRLFTTTELTLREIGEQMGGRDHSTVSYWIREYRDKVA